MISDKRPAPKQGEALVGSTEESVQPTLPSTNMGPEKGPLKEDSTTWASGIANIMVPYSECSYGITQMGVSKIQGLYSRHHIIVWLLSLDGNPQAGPPIYTSNYIVVVMKDQLKTCIISTTDAFKGALTPFEGPPNL